MVTKKKKAKKVPTHVVVTNEYYGENVIAYSEKEALEIAREYGSADVKIYAIQTEYRVKVELEKVGK